MERDTLDTFAVGEPQERGPLANRRNLMLALMSASAIAAAIAAWLVDSPKPTAEVGAHGAGDPLSELVDETNRSAELATAAAADLPPSLGAPSPAAPFKSTATPTHAPRSPSASSQGREGAGKPAAEDEAVATATAAPAQSESELGNQAKAELQPPRGSMWEGALHVQVASFRLKETADELAERLRQQGFQAHSDPYGSPRAGWWHVVRLGPFQARVEAEKQRLKLGPVERATAVVLPRARGPYHVQVASLRSKEKADGLLKRLQKRGYLGRISTVDKGTDGRWHCVRIGPLDTRDEAADFKELLQAREGIEGQVIPFSEAT